MPQMCFCTINIESVNLQSDLIGFVSLLNTNVILAHDFKHRGRHKLE